MYRPIAAACAALALAACATPTVYAPANPNSASAVGFSEYRIENNRYRVTFQGGAGAPAQLVNDYAILRAAEITLRDGYDWLQVVDRFGSGGVYSRTIEVVLGRGARPASPDVYDARQVAASLAPNAPRYGY